MSAAPGRPRPESDPTIENLFVGGCGGGLQLVARFFERVAGFIAGVLKRIFGFFASFFQAVFSLFAVAIDAFASGFIFFAARESSK